MNKTSRKRKNIFVKIIRLFDKLIIAPITSFLTFSVLLFGGATVFFTILITLLGFIAGCGISNVLVNSNLLNKNDNLLLSRIFPSIRNKQVELEKNKYYLSHYNSLIEELNLKESFVNSQLDKILDDLSESELKYDNLIEVYFKTKEKELLPYYRELKDVIEMTIKNPEQFYINICNGLTGKERKDIIEGIECKSCANCTNISCKLTCEEKQNVNNCESWYNELEIGKSKVLK